MANVIDTLKLSPDEFQRILGKLALAKAPSAAAGDHRRAARHGFNGGVLLLYQSVDAEHGARDESTQFFVRCRNISATGVGFLHGAFLHPETACAIIVINRQRQGLRVAGKVVRCRHVQGHVHEVGVAFDAPIELASILPAAA